MVITGRSRKAVGPQGPREFESHPLRIFLTRKYFVLYKLNTLSERWQSGRMHTSMMRFSKKELEIIGVALYSCEGTRLRRDKRRKNEVYYWVIEFTNSNFKLVEIFLEFL